jgi:ATP-dependent RNA helicase RhlE
LKFSDFGLTKALLEGLESMRFEEATPIQEQAIPAIMEGRDVLACAQTGTGKTAAFLLPVLHRITESPPSGIDTLIIVPTRELAMQIDQQLEGFSYFTPVSAVAIYGGRDGHSMELERNALKRGAPIVIATPGRFIAHLDLGYANLSTVRHLILDEADRMLDMGFAPDIDKIVSQIPRSRQTLMFSATMPPQIRRFAKDLLREPLEISISISRPAETILQLAFEVEDEAKYVLVEKLLAERKELGRAIIFAGAKIKVREVATRLAKRGMQVAAIHSDLDQSEREERLLAFRNGTLPIVVATDVLSRGIDVKGIDLVINFDVPGDPEDYVHRIGRTGRAEANGEAITFINRKDRGRFARIEKLIGRVIVKQLPDGTVSNGGENRPPRDDRKRPPFRDDRKRDAHHGSGKPQAESTPDKSRNRRWKKKRPSGTPPGPGGANA